MTLLALAALATLAAGCGSSDELAGDGSHPDYNRALAGSPAPLAALHAAGNELLGGGVDAFEKQLRELRGFPVVVNIWASWCGPCRHEFPILQELSARWGKQVAFLGVNSQDAEDAAATYLASVPVPYPSFNDPDQDIARSLGGGVGLPEMAYFDRQGELILTKRGGYSDRADLEADIRSYALEGA